MPGKATAAEARASNGVGGVLVAPPPRLAGRPSHWIVPSDPSSPRTRTLRAATFSRAAIAPPEAPASSPASVAASPRRSDRLNGTSVHPWRQAGWPRSTATWVLVTHDVGEAVMLGDHVAVLRGHPACLPGWTDVPLS